MTSGVLDNTPRAADYFSPTLHLSLDESGVDHCCPSILTFHPADTESSLSHRQFLGRRVTCDGRPRRTHRPLSSMPRDCPPACLGDTIGGPSVPSLTHRGRLSLWQTRYSD